MSSRRYLYAIVLAVTIPLAAPHAHAISLTLAGPEPESVGPAADLTSTIWASAPDGPFVKIATLGAQAPGGGTFTDIGVPSISPDNQVIFGAEVTATGFGALFGSSTFVGGNKSGTFSWCSVAYLENGDGLSATGQGTYESNGKNQWSTKTIVARSQMAAESQARVR